MGIVITHGPDPAFETAAAMQRAWTDALQLGLERAGVGEPRSIDIRFAFNGDIWTPSPQTTERESPTDLQSTIAVELLAEAGTRAEPHDLETLAGVVRSLDGVFGVGESALIRFLTDLDEYF